MDKKENEINVIIGKRIETLRKQKGMSPQEFAAAVHLGTSNLEKIVKGDRNLTPENAFAIAQKYNIIAITEKNRNNRSG